MKPVSRNVTDKLQIIGRNQKAEMDKKNNYRGYWVDPVSQNVFNPTTWGSEIVCL